MSVLARARTVAASLTRATTTTSTMSCCSTTSSTSIQPSSSTWIRGVSSTASTSRAHGLDAFIDASRGDEKAHVGREWLASDLRKKSFDDLHELWYVLLAERNMLLTERNLARANREPMRAPQRMTRVRKSMARIKHVLTERAIEEAGGDKKKLFELKRLINAK
jgi:large subunit ribosomal protein L47